MFCNAESQMKWHYEGVYEVTRYMLVHEKHDGATEQAWALREQDRLFSPLMKRPEAKFLGSLSHRFHRFVFFVGKI